MGQSNEMKPKSKTKNDSKKSILKKKVRRDHSGILLKKALRGKGDFTTWSIHSSSSLDKGKKSGYCEDEQPNKDSEHKKINRTRTSE